MDVDWQRLPHITWLPRSIGVTPPDWTELGKSTVYAALGRVSSRNGCKELGEGHYNYITQPTKIHLFFTPLPLTSSEKLDENNLQFVLILFLYVYVTVLHICDLLYLIDS